MDRVWKSGGSGVAPALPGESTAGYPSAGDPANSVRATVPGPYWYHMITEELRAAVSGAGLSPDAANLGQLAQALGLLRSAIVALQAGMSSGIVGYATKAAMDADLAHVAGTVGYVNADATTSNNGFYLKSGGSGSGSWTASTFDRVALVEGRVTTIETNLGNSIQQVAGNAMWFTDQYGRAAAFVETDGGFTVAYLRPQAMEWGTDMVDSPRASGTYLKTFEDRFGRVSFGLKPTGEIDIAAADVSELTADDATLTSASVERLIAGEFRQDAASATALPDIFGFISYGQSWTIGFDSQPALSLAQRFNNVMFNGGVRSQSISDDPAVVYTSLVPLVERNDTGTPGFPTYPCGETYCASQTDSFCERLQEENPVSVPLGTFQMFSSCPGEGDKKIEELSKGTSYYTRLMTHVQYAYNLAQTAGKSFTVPAVSWVQNTASTGFGSDGGTAAYPALLEQLRSDLDTDIKAITGQAETVKLITWQMFPDGNTSANRADQVYARHVKTADTYPHIYCVGGSYFLDQNSTAPGSVHLQNESQRWLGAQLGLVAKRVIVDGVDWSPVKPISVKKNGRVLTVRFHVPAGKLVFDTVRCALAENYGFNVFTAAAASGGTTEITVSSVTIVNRDTVRIVLASTPSAGAVLRYASKGTQQGRLVAGGIRGNLRDTQGDLIQSYGHPLHNWCICFEEPIT